MTSLYPERRGPARNRQRCQAITVTRTRFAGWALVREWGRVGQCGTVRETGFETEGEGAVGGIDLKSGYAGVLKILEGVLYQSKYDSRKAKLWRQLRSIISKPTINFSSGD